MPHVEKTKLRLRTQEEGSEVLYLEPMGHLTRVSKLL